MFSEVFPTKITNDEIDGGIDHEHQVVKMEKDIKSYWYMMPEKQ